VPDEYVNSFKPELSEAVFRWCNGASFAELCSMCDVFEGGCYPESLSEMMLMSCGRYRIPDSMLPTVGRVAAPDGIRVPGHRERES
jgi:hypothetical protein